MPLPGNYDCNIVLQSKCVAKSGSRFITSFRVADLSRVTFFIQCPIAKLYGLAGPARPVRNLCITK